MTKHPDKLYHWKYWTEFSDNIPEIFTYTLPSQEFQYCINVKEMKRLLDSSVGKGVLRIGRGQHVVLKNFNEHNHFWAI